MAVVALPTIKDAADLAVEVIRKNVPVGAVEILDEALMGVINKAGVTSRAWAVAPTLFFKFTGSASSVQDNIREVKKIAKKYDTRDFQYENDPVEQARLWSARKEALWTILALREKEGSVWSTDVAVPLSRVAELIGESNLLQNHSPTLCLLADVANPKNYPNKTSRPLGSLEASWAM